MWWLFKAAKATRCGGRASAERRSRGGGGSQGRGFPGGAFAPMFGVGWNQLDSRLYKPVKHVKNPWLTLKREFEQALKTTNNEELGTRVSKSVAWFYNTPYLDYWVVDR